MKTASTATAPALRRGTWLALLVMLAASLLPTLGRAMAAGQGTGTHWVEVCTPQGMRLVALADAGTALEATPPAEAQLEHCALCLLAAQPLMGPPAPSFILPPPGHAPAPVGQRPAEPLADPAWPAALPRGPPPHA